MGYKVDNAVIMVAGMSSRFAPISYEKHKALIEVKGEILIERQIRQLLEKGITDIILVVGYKKEQFCYLKEKYGITILENKDYHIRNNNSSIYVVRNYLKNSYICSADNYFTINPFEKEVDESYYAAVFALGETDEWCLQTDEDDYITEIEIGGSNQWYMLGHAFWDENFSHEFIRILEKIYDDEDTKNKLWEAIYREHIHQLRMKIRRYVQNQIFEFDSLDELRLFDSKYIKNSGSLIMKNLTKRLNCHEDDLTDMKPIKNDNGDAIGAAFICKGIKYQFLYETGEILNAI